MTVYKYFVKSAWRHRWIAIVYLAIFMFFSVMNISRSVERENATFEPSHTKIGIICHNEGETAKDLCEYLKGHSVVKEVPEDLADAKETIFLEKVDAIVVIPSDFEQRLQGEKSAVEVIFDFKNMKGHLVSNYLNKYLMLLKATEQNGTYDAEKVLRVMKKEIPVSLISDKRESSHSGNLDRWFRSYYNFAAYIMLAIYIGVIGTVMSDFKEENVVKRIHSSAKSNFRVQIQTYFGQLSAALSITGFLAVASLVLQRKHLAQIHLFKYLANILIFSLVALGITFLINNLTNNRSAKSALSTVVSLGLAFISGIMIDQEFLSGATIKIAKFFPAYYFVKLNNLIAADTTQIITYLGIQLLFAAAFLVLGIYFGKQKRTG